MTAAALRRPVITFLDAVEDVVYRRATSGALDEFPLVTLGAAVKATTVGELAAFIERACVGPGLRLAARQESALRLDGKNAERVAAFVAACVRGHFGT